MASVARSRSKSQVDCREKILVDCREKILAADLED